MELRVNPSSAKASKAPFTARFTISAGNSQEEKAQHAFDSVKTAVAELAPTLLPVLLCEPARYHTWCKNASPSAIKQAQQELSAFCASSKLPHAKVAKAFCVDPKSIRTWTRQFCPAAVPRNVDGLLRDSDHCVCSDDCVRGH